jgi:hypothetical protein
MKPLYIVIGLNLISVIILVMNVITHLSAGQIIFIIVDFLLIFGNLFLPVDYLINHKYYQN